MKTAIYIEDGTVQLVVTPETAFEKNALSTLQENKIEAKLFSGAFYDCRGGWIRQTAHQTSGQFHSSDAEDHSLILRVKTETDG
jgi:hypothetical protein